MCVYLVTCIGDASAASNLSEEEVDKRVKMYVDLEDPDIIMDLRSHNTGHGTKYDIFWTECEKFLQEDIGLAVDERRHTSVTHLARVLSVRDLLQQVTARCPPSTPIPSRSWLSLQFWPKTMHAKSRLQYTGRFNVKYMVQARQFRKEHEDSHYAAAIFGIKENMQSSSKNTVYLFVWTINTRLKLVNQTTRLQLLNEGEECLSEKMRCLKLEIMILPN